MIKSSTPISPDTPLYNHPLPEIEQWLVNQGCQQDPADLNTWTLQKADWSAEILLEIDSIVVRYLGVGENGQDLIRGFKYSLSRQDLTDAIFAGP
jgi:Protein of unknown function (DUF3143)